MVYSIIGIQTGTTALYGAIRNGHYDCVLLLIQAGADVDNQNIVSTLLFIIMVILMTYLIDITQWGSTALHEAAVYGRCDSAKLLIQSGADVDIQKNVSLLDVNVVYNHDHTHETS